MNAESKPAEHRDGASVDEAEIARFTAIAEEWWDPNGKFKPLHQLNPVRLGYISRHCCGQFARGRRCARIIQTDAWAGTTAWARSTWGARRERWRAGSERRSEASGPLDLGGAHVGVGRNPQDQRR